MIAGHNEARRQYGVGAALAWDEGLASDARAYAEVLARTDRFEHDPQRGRDPQQGENLWMGTRTAYSYADMIGHLVDERRYYRPGRFPGCQPDRRLVASRPLYPDRLADFATRRLRDRIQPRQ